MSAIACWQPAGCTPARLPISARPLPCCCVLAVGTCSHARHEFPRSKLRPPAVLLPCSAAVVRERVYDIRRAVAVVEGEPMEMEG